MTFAITALAAALLACFASRKFHFILSHGRCAGSFKKGKDGKLVLKMKRTWVLKLMVGRGAGNIGGFTAYVGVNVKGGSWEKTHSIRKFEAAVTRNANNVPYPDDSYWKTVYFSAHDAKHIVQYGMSH